MGSSLARARGNFSFWLLAVGFLGLSVLGCSGSSDDSLDGSSPTASVPETPAAPNPVTSPDPTSPPDTPSSPPSSNPIAATDTTLTLAWQPNTDSIAGYIVYYGPSADQTTNLAVQLSLADSSFAQAPKTSFNAGSDLGLQYGDRVCFRLRAYNTANMLSGWSQAACADI